MSKLDWNKEIVINWVAVKKVLDKAYKVLEILFLVVFGLSIFNGVLGSAMMYYVLPEHFMDYLTTLTCWIVFLKVLCSLDKYKKAWIVLLLSKVVFELLTRNSLYNFQLNLWIFLVGAVGVNYKKILKVFFWCALSALVVTVLGSFSGIATHLIYEKNGRLRYSFGILYPTDFSAYVLFTTFAGWCSYGEKKNIQMSIIFFAEAAFLYIFCVAWCSSAIAVLAAVAALYIHFKEKHEENRLIYKAVSFLEQWAFLICGTVMLTLTGLYSEDNSFLAKINSALSGRLELGKSAFDKYGVHLFGTYFTMIGAGGSDSSVSANYNFVDSSYCLILVRYGVLMLITFLVLYLITAYRAKKSGREVFLAIIALMAAHSMIEHHWSDMNFNPFLILFFSSMQGSETVEITENSLDNEIEKKSPLNIILKVLAVLYIVLLGALLTPYCSVLRTIGQADFGTFSWYLGIDKYIDKYFVYAILLFAGVLFTFAGLFSEKRRRCLVLGIICHAVVAAITVVILTSRYDVYRQSLDKEVNLRHIIEYAQQENCDLYVDTVPVFYRKYGYTVKDKLVLGNGLCYEENSLFVVGAGAEYKRLLDNGYIYCETSEDTALYTNNASLISELENMKLKIVKEFK